MLSNKNILLTFDYEPFLGKRSGTIDKCIIEPTNALRNILCKYNAKAVFFVDVLFVEKLRNIPELKADYEKIANQIQFLYLEGHYIYPHIHPHWLDAIYTGNGEFDLSNLKKYSMGSLQNKDVKKLFNIAFNILDDIGISYVDWGYRAGGWCIQSFKTFKQVFESHNIKFEFSVLPGYKCNSIVQSFDYSSVKIVTPYSFSNYVENVDIDGEFVEFPISTIQISDGNLFFDRLVKKILWKKGDRGFGDGLSAETASLKTNSFNREMVSLDILNISKVGIYKNFLKNNDYMHWISHPKMFTKHGLKVFDKFLTHATSNYIVNFDFVNMYKKNNYK
jgi:hypothetical protein